MFIPLIVKLTAVDLAINTSAVQNATAGMILLANSPSGTGLNPAYFHPGVESGISYLFGIRELPYYTFHLAASRNKWGFYLGATHLAHPQYKESSFNLSLNYRSSFFATGSSLRMVHNRISEYYVSSAYLADVGFLFSKEDFSSAFAVRNISQTRFQGDILPVVLLWEMNYQLTPHSSLSLGVEKEKDYDFTYKIGAYYRLHPYLALLCSYQYEPDRIGAGVILLPSPIRASYSIQTHRYLDITHFLSLTYE